MKERKEFEITTNSRVYNILNKELHSDCSIDTWHPRYWGNWGNDNDRWETYSVVITEYYCSWKNRYVPIGEGSYPNWKIVSKNKKQWQKKPLIIKRKFNSWEQQYDEWADIEWKIRKRQKPRY